MYREFTASLGYMRSCQKRRGVRERQREGGRKENKRRQKEMKGKERKKAEYEIVVEKYPESPLQDLRIKV